MPSFLERAVPTKEDQRLASRTSQHIDKLNTASQEVRLQILGAESSGEAIAIPATAFKLLQGILKEMAKGNAVTILPVEAMLTTQEAADILNVSRPFVVELLKSGKIPYQRLGTHRRLRLADLMTFKHKADSVGNEALRMLTEEAQELGMGY